MGDSGKQLDAPRTARPVAPCRVVRHPAGMAEPTLADLMAAVTALRADVATVKLQNAQQIGLLTALTAGAQIMSAEMDTLSAQVTQTLTVEQSAVTLIQGLAAQIVDAAGDRTKSLALAGTLKTSADALAAAITANTPAAPPPVG